MDTRFWQSGISRDALKLLEIEKVDGLFVDVHMPCLDGIELTPDGAQIEAQRQVPSLCSPVADDGETMRKGFNMASASS